MKYLQPLIKAINENLPKPIEEVPNIEPIVTKSNDNLLPIGTKVRVSLDQPKDITGKNKVEHLEVEILDGLERYIK